jgi:hypothetical protein
LPRLLLLLRVSRASCPCDNRKTSPGGPVLVVKEKLGPQGRGHQAARGKQLSCQAGFGHVAAPGKMLKTASNP